MKPKTLMLGFSIIAIILILFGLIYMFFGLGILPVKKDVLLNWETALYGAIMTGWAVTLLLVGRIAFRRDDKDLKKALLAGIAVWLMFEAFFSAKLHVWFNVGVDAGVLLLFSVPLLKRPDPK